jgi:hypothetical protein
MFLLFVMLCLVVSMLLRTIRQAAALSAVCKRMLNSRRNEAYGTVSVSEVAWDSSYLGHWPDGPPQPMHRT